MPRNGIDYAQVAAAAAELAKNGQKPTTRAVRALTGGSFSTVLKHLRQYLAEHPAAPPPAGAQLPVGLQRALSEALGQVASQARAEAERALQDANQEIQDLI